MRNTAGLDRQLRAKASLATPPSYLNSDMGLMRVSTVISEVSHVDEKAKTFRIKLTVNVLYQDCRFLHAYRPDLSVYQWRKILGPISDLYGQPVVLSGRSKLGDGDHFGPFREVYLL